MDKKSIIKALRDTAQSASNAIASNVSGPVDLLAAGLRGVGLPVNNPVGGSQWMAEKGLTRDVEMGVPRIVGETLGMAGPAVVAAKAPQIASGINKAAANAMAPRTLNPQTGAIVWHGSPHKFDKFDSSKIGTGEGAQAYGHGLYLAESPETASFYRDKLTTSGTILSRGDALEARSNVLRKVADRVEKSDPARAAKLRAEAETFTRDGALYKVDLPDDAIAKMLDWDRPLSQQHPDVQAYANQVLAPQINNSQKVAKGWGDLSQPYNLMDEMTGSQFLQSLRDGKATVANITGGGGAEVSGALQKAGIPGIRYLDGGSRGTGAGTSNFVVFPGNEDILKILERNGQPLGMMGIR